MVDIEPLVVGGKMWLLVEPFFALISKVTFGRVRLNPHEKKYIDTLDSDEKRGVLQYKSILNHYIK